VIRSKDILAEDKIWEEGQDKKVLASMVLEYLELKTINKLRNGNQDSKSTHQEFQSSKGHSERH
jgi:hypothetical protein